MASEYEWVVVESFYPASTAGRHGYVHVRPAPGQSFDQRLFVECSKELSDTSRYPVGTRFRIRAKLTSKLGGTPFLYSYYGWKYEVVAKERARRRS